MFPLVHSLENIWRQRHRYRLFLPLLLVCALLTGFCTAVAVPCGTYADTRRDSFVLLSPEEAAHRDDQDRRTGTLAVTARLTGAGLLLVGTFAVYYVSAQMMGARRRDTGILYALGLTRGQIFLSYFTELFTVCTLALGGGLPFGGWLGAVFLTNRIGAGLLPASLADSIHLPGRLVLYAFLGLLTALLPLLRQSLRLLREEPADILRTRL